MSNDAHQTGGKKVATILAAFNGEVHLQEQLDSIEHQTRAVDLLVIADDCSTDSSARIIREFESRTSLECLIIVNEKTLGYVENFHCLMYCVAGFDYIFFADQDDIWYPRRVERMVAKLDEAGGGLVFCDADLIDSGGVAVGETWVQRLVSHGATSRQHGLGCATAVTGKLLRAMLPLPPKTAHDNWLHFVADNLGCRHLLETPLMKYRIHEGGTSKSRYKIPAVVKRVEKQSKAMRDKINRNLPLSRYHIRRLFALARTYVKYKLS
jgi:glycosyltransferase involved in cell wall biosynthesis